MRKTVYKWFWAWDFDKEEEWLNEMAAKGLALAAISYCKYTFEESLPGEYNIRLELLQNSPTHMESHRYIAFLEETGAEYLGSVMSWVYFRQKTEAGQFDLYSDNLSRIQHLNRLLALISVLSIVESVLGLSNLFFYYLNGEILSLAVGLLCLSFGILVGYGVLRISHKKQNLKKELQLYE